MNIENISDKMNNLTLQKTDWNNRFKSFSTQLNKDVYTKEDIILLLNNFEDELLEKFNYYLKVTSMSLNKSIVNNYTGKCY